MDGRIDFDTNMDEVLKEDYLDELIIEIFQNMFEENAQTGLYERRNDTQRD